MTCYKRLECIPITRIDFKDLRYSVWAWSSYENIKSSIKINGIQCPPVIVEQTDSQYAILSGHKRLRAAKEIDINEITCIIIGPDQFSIQLFINTVAENLTLREYNPIEKGLIIKKIEEYPSCGELVENIYKAMNIGPHNLKLFKNLLNLDLKVQEAIACGKLKEGVWTQLVDLPHLDQVSFVSLLESIDLNKNTQKEILDLLVELAHINASNIINILNNNVITGIIGSTELNGPQKADHLKQSLKVMRYPSLAEHEHRVQAIVNSIERTKNILIENKFPFEDDALKISLSLKNRKNLAAAIAWLESLAGKPGIDAFFEIITARKK